MEQIKQWFTGLEDSEKRIVMIAAAFFGILIVFFGIIKPLNDSVSRLELAIVGRQNTVNNFKDAMPKILANRGGGSSASSSQGLSTVVTSTTRRFNLKVSRVQEKTANEMQVWLDNVPFNDFVRWVAELESKHQIAVTSVNIRNKDRNGLISTDIKIQRG